MPTEVKMPQLGASMTEGTITKWLKREGEAVAKGDPLLEIETDKVVTEVESPISGVLRQIVAADGATVAVEKLIGVIGQPGEDVAPIVAATAPAAAGVTAAVQAQQPEPPTAERVIASPRAKKIAEENGLDLSRVKGTGPGGRIMEKDVEVALAARASAATAAPTRPAPAPQPAPVAAAVPAPAAPRPVPMAPPPVGATPGAGRSIRVAGMRKVIADRMSASQTATAHVTLNAEVDMGEAAKLREQANAEWEKQGLGKLTFTDVIVKAVAKALREHPRINASLGDGEIREYATINVGVAVALDEGLVVPVIRDADTRTLMDISRSVRDLADRGRKNALTVDELKGGTFTITNMGMLGVETFTPIINFPECAILGIGRIAERAVVRGGQIVPRPTMWLSLTFDHRIIDGAPAAQYLARVKQLLESPYLLFV